MDLLNYFETANDVCALQNIGSQLAETEGTMVYCIIQTIISLVRVLKPSLY
jgi:hypothetical protein